MLIFLIIQFGLHMHQMNVDNAYLLGQLLEEIYLEIPEGMTSESPNEALLLLKDIYGLKQSGRVWHKKLSKFLASIDFQSTNSDPCVFVNAEKRLIIALYMNDMLLIGETEKAVIDLKKKIKKQYKMKNMGVAKVILGIQIELDRTRGIITLDQINYLRNFLHEEGIKSDIKKTRPMLDYNALTSSEPHEERADKQHYQHVIGKLMYAMKDTRPDLCFALRKLSQFCLNPCIRHKNALDDLLQYVNNTVDYKLIFKKRDKITSECHSDSTYADDLIDRKSTYGAVLFLNKTSCIWYSKKLRSIATSSTEAEYMVLCQTSKTVVWAARWLQKLKILSLGPAQIPIMGDNLGANGLTKDPEHHVRTKHIDVQYHYIRKVVELGTVIVNHIPSSQNAADILTKPLNKTKFINGLKLLRFAV